MSDLSIFLNSPERKTHNKPPVPAVIHSREVLYVLLCSLSRVQFLIEQLILLHGTQHRRWTLGQDRSLWHSKLQLRLRRGSSRRGRRHYSSFGDRTASSSLLTTTTTTEGRSQRKDLSSYSLDSFCFRHFFLSSLPELSGLGQSLPLTGCRGTKGKERGRGSSRTRFELRMGRWRP